MDVKSHSQLEGSAPARRMSALNGSASEFVPGRLAAMLAASPISTHSSLASSGAFAAIPTLNALAVASEGPDKQSDEGSARRHSDVTSVTKQLVRQVEYYFSNKNLWRDPFMQGELAKNSEQFVSLECLLTFPRIKAITEDVNMLSCALKQSTKLELSKDNTMVRRIHPLPAYQADPKRSIYVGNLPEGTTAGTVQEMFKRFGPVTHVFPAPHVSILFPNSPSAASAPASPPAEEEAGQNDKLAAAFVEFEKQGAAKKAVALISKSRKRRRASSAAAAAAAAAAAGNGPLPVSPGREASGSVDCKSLVSSPPGGGSRVSSPSPSPAMAASLSSSVPSHMSLASEASPSPSPLSSPSASPTLDPSSGSASACVSPLLGPSSPPGSPPIGLEEEVDELDTMFYGLYICSKYAYMQKVQALPPSPAGAAAMHSPSHNAAIGGMIPVLKLNKRSSVNWRREFTQEEIHHQQQQLQQHSTALNGDPRLERRVSRTGSAAERSGKEGSEEHSPTQAPSLTHAQSQPRRESKSGGHGNGTANAASPTGAMSDTKESQEPAQRRNSVDPEEGKGKKKKKNKRNSRGPKEQTPSPPIAPRPQKMLLQRKSLAPITTRVAAGPDGSAGFGRGRGRPIANSANPIPRPTLGSSPKPPEATT